MIILVHGYSSWQTAWMSCFPMCKSNQGVTYSMEQCPSWKANRFSASQKFLRILWNPMVHYRTHKCAPPVPVLIQSISPGPRLIFWLFRNMTRFYGEKLLASRPNPKLEDHPLSAVSDCLFNIFAATLHIGGRSSIRNLRTHHAVVTGIHLTGQTRALRIIIQHSSSTTTDLIIILSSILWLKLCKDKDSDLCLVKWYIVEYNLT
jgi:hypothetical protein